MVCGAGEERGKGEEELWCLGLGMGGLDFGIYLN